MNKKMRMRVVFFILAIAFLIIAVTGICMDLKIMIFPKGITKSVHIYLGYLMIVAVIVHLIDNRMWIKNLLK